MGNPIWGGRLGGGGMEGEPESGEGGTQQPLPSPSYTHLLPLSPPSLLHCLLVPFRTYFCMKTMANFGGQGK